MESAFGVRVIGFHCRYVMNNDQRAQSDIYDRMQWRTIHRLHATCHTQRRNVAWPIHQRQQREGLRFTNAGIGFATRGRERTTPLCLVANNWLKSSLKSMNSGTIFSRRVVNLDRAVWPNICRVVFRWPIDHYRRRERADKHIFLHAIIPLVIR